jgi:hypothetical protein
VNGGPLLWSAARRTCKYSISRCSYL